MKHIKEALITLQDGSIVCILNDSKHYLPTGAKVGNLTNKGLPMQMVAIVLGDVRYMDANITRWVIDQENRKLARIRDIGGNNNRKE